MTGITMGGGVGVSVHGSHRVASERLTFAMPETGIGLFPDVGGTYFLPRCPGEIGMYLALTGSRLKAADALYAGIVTHHVPSGGMPDLISALCDTGDPDHTLAEHAQDPGAPTLKGDREAIDRCFSGSSVPEILARLDEDGSEWAAKCAATIRGKSPTSSRIAYCQIREGAGLSFEDCMRLEYRMVNRIYTAHDFYEGIRAVVIDKDQAPMWQPATLDDVSDERVAAYFAPLEDELALP